MKTNEIYRLFWKCVHAMRQRDFMLHLKKLKHSLLASRNLTKQRYEKLINNMDVLTKDMQCASYTDIFSQYKQKAILTTLQESLKEKKVNHPVNKSLGRLEIRSNDGQLLHTLIFRASDAHDIEELNSKIKEIEDCMNSVQLDALLERSINGHTHLHDIAHLPYKRNKNPRMAKMISERLFSLFWAHLPKTAQKFCLNAEANGSITLFQSALMSKSLANVQALYAVIQKDFTLLINNLNNRTQKGVMPLQAAIRSGSIDNVRFILEALKKAPKILANNLNNSCHKGNGPLLDAAFSNNITIFVIILNVLRKHPDALERNLSNLENNLDFCRKILSQHPYGQCQFNFIKHKLHVNRYSTQQKLNVSQSKGLYFQAPTTPAIISSKNLKVSVIDTEHKQGNRTRTVFLSR